MQTEGVKCSSSQKMVAIKPTHTKTKEQTINFVKNLETKHTKMKRRKVYSENPSLVSSPVFKSKSGANLF